MLMPNPDEKRVLSLIYVKIGFPTYFREG